MIDLDPDRCYLAATSRDARFDGWFILAVRTTGIYCRPSCPALTPKRSNVEFYRSSAAAQQRGYRACKRCRPDASPGSPEWDVRGDVAARAMRYIADGVVDREGVDGLAGRLGYSARHLGRVLEAEVGAGPLALARARRAQTARILIETSDLSMTQIAFAAGFGSIRQFNDTVRATFAATPSELRRASAHRPAGGHHQPSAGSIANVDRSGCDRSAVASGRESVHLVSVRLATRAPFAGGALFDFLAHRAVPGVEHWDGVSFHRALDLPLGHGVASLRPGDDHVVADIGLEDWRDLAPAVQRLRRLLDLDADAVAIDDALASDPVLGGSVRAEPGRRAAGSVDPRETALRAIIGQQVSVAGARTVTGHLVRACDRRLRIPHEHLSHVFPDPEAVVASDLSALPMPASRRATLQRLSAALVEGDVVLDPGVDRVTVVDALLALRGIGPWTAGYVLMRGLGDPDVMLGGDLGVQRALEACGLSLDHTERWRPWRTYALHHLWASEPASPLTPHHTSDRHTTPDTRGSR